MEAFDYANNGTVDVQELLLERSSSNDAMWGNGRLSSLLRHGAYHSQIGEEKNYLNDTMQFVDVKEYDP